MQKIVLVGLLLRNEKEKKQLINGFKEQGFKVPKVIHQFKTLAGQGGEGGRSDVIAEVDDKDVPKLAVHPFHLSGLFSWADDYYDNNKEIIPKDSLEYFTEKKDTVEKPVCKIIGTDGNVFNIIGKVKRTLVKAGMVERAQEFQNRAMKSKSYDEVLSILSEYVEVK